METKQQNKKCLVRDGVLLGDWQEVSGLPLSSVTKKDTDTATLDGLIIKGYETKFNVTNENGERYAPNCLDKFVQQYFVDHELNMVVDLQHSEAVDDQVGRVIYFVRLAEEMGMDLTYTIYNKPLRNGQTTV